MFKTLKKIYKSKISKVAYKKNFATTAIFLLVLFALSLTQFCKKKSDSKFIIDDSQYNSINGSWEVIPSVGKKIIFNGTKKGILIAGGAQIPLILKLDSIGLRLIVEGVEKPIGYFTLSEKKEFVWMGILEDEVVKLTKINSKSSVLE